jgi:BirA family biotin operon repressor/biotin-[acetyl-CoA-carboxylase] ligase
MTRDIISPALIADGLPARFIGQKVIYYPRLTSTMDAARQKIIAGAPEGTVIMAGEQTAGRGRLKRLWSSPAGGIALSVILYPQKDYLPYLIMLASLAVVRSIALVTGLEAQLKWPNDVLIHGKKVCGILVESDIEKNRVAYAIIGIGINANFKLAAFPEISPLATSLSDELGEDVPRVAIIRHLLIEMERLYLTLPDGEPIYQAWRNKLATLGKRVRVTSGESRLEGIAEAVARDGRLLLRQTDERLTEIIAGDVSLRDDK